MSPVKIGFSRSFGPTRRRPAQRGNKFQMAGQIGGRQPAAASGPKAHAARPETRTSDRSNLSSAGGSPRGSAEAGPCCVAKNGDTSTQERVRHVV